MSIEIKKPITLLEKVDAAANLVEQMFLAHVMRDEKRFRETHKDVSKLLFDVTREVEKISEKT